MPTPSPTPRPIGIGLLGQPNSGKSTLFNALTGLRQHIANYPGVTVEKKTGNLRLHGQRVELVDLPGTYSLNAFSPEERVVSDYLLHASPRAVINVLDATQLRRGLSLTLQALEMGLPLIAVLNMSDVALRNQQPVDAERLAAALGTPVVSTVGRRGDGIEPLTRALEQVLAGDLRVAARLPDYGPLEDDLETIAQALPPTLRSRWLALHLLDGESDIRALLGTRLSNEALDRVLHRFGLHGQSTLPFVLGGVFAGGCAVPGVMATKAIPDPRARLATILTVPYMNCLAKVPLYTLLIGIFFVDHKGLMLFFIATITVMVALLVARLLTLSILRPLETVPFVMEMPRYHLPTLRGVVRPALDRTWLYIKKVGTIVLAVAVVIFVLLNLPGLSDEERADFDQRAQTSLQSFQAAIEGNPHAAVFQDAEMLLEALNLATAYRARRMNLSVPEAVAALDARAEAAHPDLFPFIRPGAGERDARDIHRALRLLDQERRTLRQEMQETRIVNSVLGRAGRALEPVTQAAGFDWKVNVALLSSFAARESSVATLGVLFQQEEGGTQTLEQRMGAAMSQEHAALVALSLIVFFAIYPPCLATAIMVRIQTASTGWMLFSIVFPTVLGLLLASAVYTTGVRYQLDALTMMASFWTTVLALLLIIGLWPQRRRIPSRPRFAEGTGGI